MIRDLRPDDLNFILATWLRGLYYGCAWFSQIPKDIFMSNYRPVIEAILLNGTTRVACLKDDQDVILGYSVCGREDSVLHWTFVKSSWRGIGVARSLIPPSVKIVTHLTKIGSGFLRSHPAIVFNPFLIP